MTSSLEPSRATLRHAIDSKTRFRLRLLLVLLMFKTFAVLQLLTMQETNLIWLLVGIVGGIVIGVIASRMYVTTWDYSAQTVVSQMDAVGIVVLIAYLLYSFFGDNLVEMGIENAAAASLVVTSMAAAATLTRLAFMYRSVAEVLRDAGLLRRQ